MPDEYATEMLRRIGGIFVLMVMVGLWAYWNGTTKRITYIGRAPESSDANGVLIRTEPEFLPILPPSIDIDQLKSGCRYDLNFAPVAGRWAHNKQFRVIRAVTPVDCP
ncbi:MAG: hypothetical protein ACXWJW_02420 [Xanthobacteraceae bacterium]